MRLARSTRPDQQDVVLVRLFHGGHNAGKYVLHYLFVADEQGFEGLPVHVAGAVARTAQDAFPHSRVSFHHRLTSRHRKS